MAEQSAYRRGRRPAESRAELRGDIGEDLHVVLVVEGERKGERHLVDLLKGRVRPELPGDLRGGPDEIWREQHAAGQEVPLVRSSASRSGFSQPSGMTAVPS